MNKKLGQYLPAIALAIFALALLCSTGANRSAPGQTVPPAQTTAPAADGTVPDPAAGREEASPDALPRVEEILSGYQLDETASAVCVYDEALHGDEDGRGASAVAHALARLCSQRRMNPISAFWMLAGEGLYDYEPDGDGVLGVGTFEVPGKIRKAYSYSAAGARRLLSDILDLARDMEDGMDLESAFLSWNGMVESDRIFHAEGDCYYTYFVYYGESAAHFLCFYVRGEERIDRLEFQMLNLCYREGTLGPGDGKGETQAALLMAAAERLLTGSSRVSEGQPPLGYDLEGAEVAIERYDVTGSGEIGSLINYGISLKP